MNIFSIAIDGPAGAGKSTIAKQLAKKLGCIYIDTGAMYRAVGYYCVQNNKDYKDEDAVKSVLDQINLRLECTEQGQEIYLNDENVSQDIRTDHIAAAASKVATYEQVREKMVACQQQMAKQQSVVMDGRDIGTVVLPFATVKIFLTATVEERARRRFEEYKGKQVEVSLEQLQEEIKLRDEQDCTRKISPLKKAEDAIELDTTFMTIPSIVEEIHGLLMQRLSER